MKLKTKKFDVADYLDSEEMIELHLNAAFESGDTSRIAEALGDIARARGMAGIARTTGLSRQQLYKSLSAEGRPELETVLLVMSAFGFGLKANIQAPSRRKSAANKHKAA